MRATDMKIKRILEKDYSDSLIRKGQEWYIGHGIFLECSETKEHLLELMEYCKKAVESAQLLKNAIDGELGQYRSTDNLFGSVLDLSESLGIIEEYAREYIRTYEYLSVSDSRLQAAPFNDEDPFNTTADDLPF